MPAGFHLPRLRPSPVCHSQPPWTHHLLQCLCRRRRACGIRELRQGCRYNGLHVHLLPGHLRLILLLLLHRGLLLPHLVIVTACLLITPHRDRVCGPLGGGALVEARDHHHQQLEVTAAALKAVGAGGGDEDRPIPGHQQAVRAEHNLCTVGVHRHQVRMGPERLGCEGPHGLFATRNVSPTSPQGHVQAFVPPHVLQPCLVQQAPQGQAHRQGEAFLGLGRPDITGVVTQDRRVPQLDTADLAVVRGRGHHGNLPGDLPWALSLRRVPTTTSSLRSPPRLSRW